MPDVPFSRRQALVGALAVLVALVVVGRLITGGDDGVAAPLEVVAEPGGAASAAAEVVVHVVGAVREPGLYRLTEGRRVADALELAGGPTRRADLSLVNLAAPVADGTQVVVPVRAEQGGAGGGASAAGAAAAAGPVHLNSATVEQLDALPGIGPVTAQKIVDWRQAHGAFTSVDDLDAVPGIGPARIEQLRELVAP